MTKLIGALIIILVLYGGWKLFLYWEQIKNDQDLKQQQDAAAMVMGNQLPGLPSQLEPSLQEAEKRGAAGLRSWLKLHGQSVEDPRKAWIELDYCVAVAPEDPAEARRVFASVKERIGPNSPVWSRLKGLEKTYN